MNALEERHELQLAFLTQYTQVRRRPWGLLLYNLENPHYYEANGARYVRTENPDTAISEIVQFYRTRRLTPRVTVDGATEPSDFRQRLEARGFESSQNDYRIMTWQGECPETPSLPVGAEIVQAGRDHVEAIVTIEAEDSPWGGGEWLRRRTQTLLAAPAVHFYIAWVHGEPAATAMCFQTDRMGMVDSVATRPAYRRRGLASALIAHIQSETSTPLLLDVDAENAERVYARRGFVVAADAPEWSCWLPAD